MNYFKSKGLSNEIRLIVKNNNRKPSLIEDLDIYNLIY